MYNPFSLKGKTILITGASSGIGKEIALECAKLSANLIILGRNEERLKAVFNNLEGIGHSYFICDINNSNEIDKMCDAISNIDGLVHSAGIVKTLPFKFVNKENLENIFNTNFFAPVLLTSKIISKKKINKLGSIVFISSLGGNYIATYGNSMYGASKGALTAISKMIALELAPQKIRVNSILPAMIKTELFNLNPSITKEQLIEDEKRYPLGSYGEPDDVAFATIYLLSNASKWVTGSSLILDGGYLLN